MFFPRFFFYVALSQSGDVVRESADVMSGDVVPGLLLVLQLAQSNTRLPDHSGSAFLVLAHPF